MFIPPKHIKDQLKPVAQDDQKVCLSSSHIHIGRDIVNTLFPGTQAVYVAFYPENKSLMICSVKDELFKSLHKANQKMLKTRTRTGNKSIAIHEIIIDNQIDGANRDLEYHIEKQLGILHVTL